MCRISFDEGIRLSAALAHQNERWSNVTPERIGDGVRRLTEALRAAELVGRYSDVALAHALLIRAALADHDRSEVEANLVALQRDLQHPSDLSARARAAVKAALAIGVQTLAPTPPG